MKDIYLYGSMDSWLDEKPDAILKGIVTDKKEAVVTIQDENGYTQIININRLFAIVY